MPWLDGSLKSNKTFKYNYSLKHIATATNLEVVALDQHIPLYQRIERPDKIHAESKMG